MLKSKRSASKTNLVKNFFSKPYSSAIIAVCILIVVFYLSTSSFLSPTNIFNVLRNASLFIFIAMAQVMALIIGGMNVSLGSIGGLSVITSGICMQTFGLPAYAAVAIALVIGCIAGFFNAIVITKFKLNAFVATLSTSFIYTGLVMGISKGYPYTELDPAITVIGRGEFLTLPLLFWLVLTLLLIMAVFFKYTLTGRRILATGGNQEAARMSGIKTNRVIGLCHILSGFFAALAGALFVSRLGSAPPATGQDWLVISFAVAIIGGTALQGGVYSSVGLLFSGVMMAIIKNGLVMMEVNQYFEQTFLGIIILLAVAIESVRIRLNRGLQ